MTQDVWAIGDAYEAYMGRWSRRVAAEFVEWLGVPAGRSWADIGCGTGALTAAVLSKADPAQVTGVDPSEGFLATARQLITDPRVSLQAGDAQALPFADSHFDVVVSGLALNFVPDAPQAAAEFARVTVAGGTAAAFVWDYAGGMQMLEYFWRAAAMTDPAASGIDEGRRFPLCQPEPLRALWAAAGMQNVAVQAIEVPTVFGGLDDFWQPFLGGTGPAPSYVMSLTEARRHALRDLLGELLPQNPGGSIPLTARAWAVRGLVGP